MIQTGLNHVFWQDLLLEIPQQRFSIIPKCDLPILQFLIFQIKLKDPHFLVFYVLFQSFKFALLAIETIFVLKFSFLIVLKKEEWFAVMVDTQFVVRFVVIFSVNVLLSFLEILIESFESISYLLFFFWLGVAFNEKTFLSLFLNFLLINNFKQNIRIFTLDCFESRQNIHIILMNFLKQVIVFNIWEHHNNFF